MATVMHKYRARLINIRRASVDLRSETGDGLVSVVLVLRDDSIANVHEVQVDMTPAQADILSALIEHQSLALKSVDDVVIERMVKDALSAEKLDGKDNLEELPPPSDDEPTIPPESG